MALADSESQEKNSVIDITGYKKGHTLEQDSVCLDPDSFHLLRVHLTDCDRMRIDYEELQIYTDELMMTKLDHTPIWKQWWVKLPVAIGVGALAGWAMGKKTDEPWVAGLVGGTAAGLTMTLFEW